MEPFLITYDTIVVLCYVFSSIVLLRIIAFTQKEKKKKNPRSLMALSTTVTENVLFMTVWDISDGSCINLENKVKKKQKEKWLLLHHKSIYPLYLKSRTQKKRKRKISSRTTSLMTWNTPAYVTGYRVSVIFIHLCT